MPTLILQGYGQNFDYGQSPTYKDDNPDVVFDFVADITNGPTPLQTIFTVINNT